MVRLSAGDTAFAFQPEQLIIAGFTGRDREHTARHVEELARQGIPAPARLPSFYRLDPSRLVGAARIDVDHPETSGEAEPVLIQHEDRWYLGIGSDHTARSLERVSIETAKRACPKVIGPEVWEYEEVQERWDRLQLRSWTDRDARLVPYQQSTLDAILPVREIIKALEDWGGSLKGETALFLGTVPLLTGVFVYGGRFAAEIWDPQARRALRCEYRVGRRAETISR